MKFKMVHTHTPVDETGDTEIELYYTFFRQTLNKLSEEITQMILQIGPITED